EEGSDPVKAGATSAALDEIELGSDPVSIETTTQSTAAFLSKWDLTPIRLAQPQPDKKPRHKKTGASSGFFFN
ncbi:hypothetical protein, partial [uncultured Pseudoteredinibacter sp.]|uniref:hypothetical protein n=1 Tax=uncultured Pseudoteredinibacter sp. TaxID=1641701 RepID=UPI00261E6071